MKDDELKTLFKKAAEISKAVPDPLREAAFNRAVDVLLGVDDLSLRTPSHKPRKPGKPDLFSPSRRNKDADPHIFDLDRMAYPQMQTVSRVLERALILLRIAKDDLGIDGLGSRLIAKVLTDKFRFRTTRQAVQQALDAAGDKVDRVSHDRKTIYRIMGPGEAYLDAGQFDTTHGHRTPKKRIDKKTKARGTPKTASQKNGSSGSQGKKPIRSSVSPTIALKVLVEEGYFSSPRRIGDIREHLQQKKGLAFKLRELSPVLLRLLRNKIIDRSKAEDGQYEYKKH